MKPLDRDRKRRKKSKTWHHEVRECVCGTYEVDPSVSHLPTGLWFIQSWSAKVRKWLQKLQITLDFNHSKERSSAQVTEESAQPGDTRDKAVEGHVQGSRSKALRQQLNYLPVALHPWTGRRTDGGQRSTGQQAAPVQDACVPMASRAALSSKGLMVPDESSSNWKKMAWERTIC